MAFLCALTFKSKVIWVLLSFHTLLFLWFLFLLPPLLWWFCILLAPVHFCFFCHVIYWCMQTEIVFIRFCFPRISTTVLIWHMIKLCPRLLGDDSCSHWILTQCQNLKIKPLWKSYLLIVIFSIKSSCLLIFTFHQFWASLWVSFQALTLS